MAGCFGLNEHHHQKAPRQVTLPRQGVCCFELMGGRGSQPGAHEAGKLPDGTNVQVKPHPFNGWNFVCPRCHRGCYRLYHFGRWACRVCHGLGYVSRHRNRTIPQWHRLAMLRRRIGAGPPFSPIAPRPIHARKFWRTVAEIRQLEAGLVQHTRQDVTASLQRRLERKE
jgi:hypothetical protein